MEKLKPHEIATHLGLDPDLALKMLNWRPELHPHLFFQELLHGKSYAEAEGHGYRVHNHSTGLTHTRLPDEPHPVDHEFVKKTYNDALAFNRKKSFEIWPLVVKAIPDLQPDGNMTVEISGKIFDLVDGKLLAPRERPNLPIFSVVGDKIIVNAQNMSDEHQTILKKTFAGHALASVVAPRAKG